MQTLHYILLIYLGLLLQTIPVNAQKITGKVVDKVIGQALPFVQIGIKGKNIGTMSDESGYFSLNSKNITTNDSLIFSYLGYEKKVVACAPLFSNENIQLFLQKTTYNLPEINIAASSFNKEKIFGYKKTKTKKMTTGWTSVNQSKRGISHPVGERGGLIKLKGHTVLLKNFYFHIANNDYDSVLFRIHLYTTKDGLPDKEITPTNIFVQTAIKSGVVKIPLDQYQIIAEENVIATVEWVKAWHQSSADFISLHLSIGFFGGLFWRDYSHQPNWKRNKKWHPGIYLNGLVTNKKLKN